MSEKIKSVVVVEGDVAKVVYYCTCGGEVYISARGEGGWIVFDLVCEGCGEREPLAMFSLASPFAQIRAFLEKYPVALVKWKEEGFR